MKKPPHGRNEKEISKMRKNMVKPEFEPCTRDFLDGTLNQWLVSKFFILAKLITKLGKTNVCQL